MSRFNPRTREGATQFMENAANSLMVSIHAPVRVRRLQKHQDNTRSFGFNPRTREGATVPLLTYCQQRG